MTRERSPRHTFDDLLDEGVEVDGERQEDLHVGQRQRVLVEGQEHVQLLLVTVVLRERVRLAGRRNVDTDPAGKE